VLAFALKAIQAHTYKLGRYIPSLVSEGPGIINVKPVTLY